MGSANPDLEAPHGQREQPRRKELTERGAKAAATRAENNEKRRREDERLIRDTAGGRKAKNDAKKNAVWKRVDTTRDGRSKVAKNTNTQQSRRRVDAVAEEARHPDGQESERRPSKVQRTRTSTPSVEKSKGHHVRDDNLNTDINDSDHPDHLDTDQLSPERKRSKHQHPSSRSQRSHSDVHPEHSEADLSPDEDRYTDSNGGTPSGSEDEDFYGVDADLERPMFTDAPGDLFNIQDQDVTMGSRSRSSSQSAPYPPTTDYSDDNDFYEAASVSLSSSKTIPLDNEDEDSPSASETGTKLQSRRSNAGGPVARREQRFREERPRVIATTVASQTKKSRSTGTAFNPDTVSPEVRVVHEGRGKLKLLEQPVTVQEVVREAIESATEDVMLRTCWPEERVRGTYGRDQLLQACRSSVVVAANDRVHLEELREVLKKDPRVAKLLGNVVTARLSLLRSPAKVEAADAIPYYQLGLGTNCEERVRSLMTRLVFHMPGSWGGVSQNEWQPNRKEAFLAPPIIATLKLAYFSTHQSTGRRFEEKFTSSLGSHPNEKEIPVSLLALGMTAVYSSLYEFQTGLKRSVDFDGSKFLTVNQELVALLEKLKEDKPIFFHDRMHQIYKLVSDTQNQAPVMHDGAYSIIEFE